ncbi:MAG: response regulator [Methanomicrobiales archaeon]
MIRILYTDDEPDLLEIGKIFLEQEEDIEVHTKICVADSLDTLATCHYDAIVSDFRMPGTDGIQFLKVIRSEGNRIPFILFTGQGREEIPRRSSPSLSTKSEWPLQRGETRNEYIALTGPFECLSNVTGLFIFLRMNWNYTGNVVKQSLVWGVTGLCG